MKDQLQKALQILKDSPWYPGSKERPAVCAHLAIRDASNDWRPVDKFFAAVNDIVEDDNLYGIPAWNDAEGRTKEQVIAAFEKAIKVAAAYEKGE